MVMYAIVSKSIEEKVQVEISHGKTVDWKCTNDFLLKNTIRLLAVGLFCIILHYNVPSHTSKEADTILENTGLTILQHSYYSLDLDPCDVFLFPCTSEENFHGPEIHVSLNRDCWGGSIVLP